MVDPLLDENKRRKSVINLRENWFDLINEQPEKRKRDGANWSSDILLKL